MLKALEQACVPRQSVFDPSVHDTVYNIDDIESIDASAFFTENYVTQGMRQLLTEAFQRLEGKSQDSSGTFLLSQSMGGGKTHNLIALGLLAKHPELRAKVMGGFYEVGPLGSVRVVSFSGRKSNTPFGIWGEIATQLNKRDAFKDFYSPLTPPGDNDWVDLLRGEPVLILLDELPPYFEAAQAKQIGATTLDVITTAALANLFVAVSSGKLPNACVVVTDLRASAYGRGNEAIAQSLQNLEKEANRVVTRIDPVRLNSDELYHILRTRLFERMPDESDIAEVADAYREAVDEAKRMDLTLASPDNMRAEIMRSYPFHPGIRDLFARFRENPGFQQTRALVRIMRIVVKNLWSSQQARHAYLVAAHQLGLSQAELMSEIRQINSSLDNAIAHDIADDQQTSVAETIDGSQSHNARDAATLIFLSSLSQAVSPTLGLTRSDIIGYLAAPERDVTGFREALDALQAQAWYLHATSNGALLFKNTENLNAKLESYVQGTLNEARESVIRQRLKDIFEPQTRLVYQRVEALPALDQVQPVPDQITLVIFKPSPTAQSEIRTFFDQQQLKNRLLFLTSEGTAYSRVLECAAYLKAIDTIIGEFQQQSIRENEPQFKEAREIETNRRSRFYQACREAFQMLYYPSNHGLTPLPLDPKYDGNRYEGENLIKQALASVSKYTDQIGPDTNFPNRVIERLWPANRKEVPWADIKRNAAQKPGWVWHHPNALDDLRAALVARDTWREHDTWVERGPFPKPSTGVSVQQLTRNSETGEVVLRLTPLHGDIVYFSEGNTATTASPRVERFDHFQTKALTVSFLCVDSHNEHEPGPPEVWRNTIDIRYRLSERSSERYCELRAIPAGDIVYTVDGSSPETSGIPYSEPFLVPDDARVIQARASRGGVSATPFSLNLPPRGSTKFQVDPAKAARWMHRLKADQTGETYDLLKTIEKYHGQLGGVRLTTTREQRWVELMTSDDTVQEPSAIRTQAELLLGIVPGGNLTLESNCVDFTSGQDLTDLADELHTEVTQSEVKQS